MRLPHEVLNVPHDASQEEIQSAYRAWTKLVHPDLADESIKGFATGLMQEINGAYAIMSKGNYSPSNEQFNGQTEVDQYLAFLKEAIESHPDGDVQQLILPRWSLPATAYNAENGDAGPFTNLYIKHGKNGNFTVSDRGENLECLSNYGNESDLEEAKNFIRNCKPVTERKNILSINRSKECPTLGEAIFRMETIIAELDSEFDSRILLWHQAEEFIGSKRQIVLISGHLSEKDQKNGMVYQSDPFTLHREGERLNILMMPNPFWVEGEVKLVRTNKGMFGNEETLFASGGFTSYSDTFIAKNESYNVPEVGIAYRLTVSGRGGILLAACVG